MKKWYKNWKKEQGEQILKKTKRRAFNFIGFLLISNIELRDILRNYGDLIVR